MPEKCHLLDLRASEGLRTVRTLLGNLAHPAYRLVFNSRRRRYLQRRSPVRGLPVISVGNLAMGGAGKTPLTIALWKLLHKRGKRGGVVLKLGRCPEAYIDEFILYLNHLASTGGTLKLHVARDRESVFAENEAGCVLAHHSKLAALERLAVQGNLQFALVDDGFQLYSLKPTLSICIASPKDWSDRLFPMGGLREETAALERADIVLLRGHRLLPKLEDALPASARNLPRLSLSPQGLIPATALAEPWMNKSATVSQESESKAGLTAESALAFSGIASPESFEHDLLGVHPDTAVCVRFSDHHGFSTGDLRMLRRLSEKHDCSVFIATEKDVCRLLPHVMRAHAARIERTIWPEELLPPVRHFTPDFTVELEAIWNELHFLRQAVGLPPEVVSAALDVVS